MGDSVNSGFMASNATANLGPGGSPPAKEESPTQREGLQPVKAQSSPNLSSNINDFCNLLYIIPI